jgi:cyclophilin family peptidyl-prolyl cis-trans isomerase
MDALAELVSGIEIDRTRSDWRTRLPAPRAVTLDPNRRYLARMETSRGTLRIRLLADTAPRHVVAFAYLARLGFFDGLGFHRVITGFMAQGGCPRGDGTGGPGFQLAGEHSPRVKHDRRGLLSAANAGPGTDGSQFFLTFVPTPWLDGKHTIYGEVVEGLDVLDGLEKAGSESGRPSEKLGIVRVEVETE